MKTLKKDKGRRILFGILLFIVIVGMLVCIMSITLSRSYAGMLQERKTFETEVSAITAAITEICNGQHEITYEDLGSYAEYASLEQQCETGNRRTFMLKISESDSARRFNGMKWANCTENGCNFDFTVF
jgi:hypothetical protein